MKRPTALLGVGLFVALAVSLLGASGCRGSFHPLTAAAGCKCTPSEYCHVRAPSPGSDMAATECLPFPAACGEKPSCNCLGRPIDACREELGAFTVLEPRGVPSCSDCAAEEYCWTQPAPMCRLIPARCEDTPTCDCLLATHRNPETLRCDQRQGRIEAGPSHVQ